MYKTYGYAAHSAKEPFAPFAFDRRDTGPHDVRIEILYCGVCHSDLHTARGEWAGTVYPNVPGHEIVGRVTEVGSEVTKFKVGALAGVGCMVDSCRTCPSCQEGLEQYCEGSGFVGTYNAPDKHTGGVTYGGYSKSIVVDEAFTLRVPENLELAAVAPLLCAGITTYSPLRHWNVQAGQKVGIVGLGGLGHMGVKLAAAFGAHVVLFTTSASKIEDAKRLGAHEVVISKDPEQMAKHVNSFDFILNTVAASHDLDQFTALLESQTSNIPIVFERQTGGVRAVCQSRAVTSAHQTHALWSSRTSSHISRTLRSYSCRSWRPGTPERVIDAFRLLAGCGCWIKQVRRFPLCCCYCKKIIR